MPKKRRTKTDAMVAKTMSGDESCNLTKEERERLENINMYLRDFDMNVANCIEQARNQAQRMCSTITNAFTMELFKLPKSFRDLTRAEFLAHGGSVNNTALQHITEVTDTLASSITTKTLMTTPSGESSASEARNDVEEIASKTATTAKKKGARGRKKTTSTATTSKRSTRTQSILKANQSMNTQDAAEPQTVRRSTRRKTTRNQFVTPATKTGKAGALASGWDTPMVTPKFDPRLPVTPATCVMREAKQKETIISLSGSPIIVPPKRDLSKPEVVIPLADGTALTVGTSSPQVDLSMDETARRNILLLQSNLAKILKRCPVQEES